MLFGEDVITMMRDFRICWIGGWRGSGKTALAERVGIEFVERGWCEHVVGNFPSVLHSDIESIECRDSYIVLDEAGVWLADKEFNKMTAYLRKRNLYIVLASTLPVVMQGRYLQFQRTFNFYKFGLPLWRFTLNLDYMNLRDKVDLWWLFPHEIYRLYDTLYEAGAEDGLALIRWVLNAYAVRQTGERRVSQTLVIEGLENGTESVEQYAGIQGMEDGGRVAQEVVEAARQISNSVSAYRDISRKRR